MTATLVQTIADDTSAVLEPLTVDQYHKMIRQGILPEGAAIELIDGLLVRKDRRDKGGSIMTVGPRHDLVVKVLHRLLSDLIARLNCHVQSQQPVTLSGIQEPEPDVAIVLGREQDYSEHHPGPGAIPLIIEVAHSSLSLDRVRKQTNYAVAGIPQCWIVNLTEDCVECYINPQPTRGEYEYHTTHRPGDILSFEVCGQQFQTAVDAILG